MWKLQRIDGIDSFVFDATAPYLDGIDEMLSSTSVPTDDPVLWQVGDPPMTMPDLPSTVWRIGDPGMEMPVGPPSREWQPGDPIMSMPFDLL